MIPVIKKLIGSGLFTGYFPYASGTAGSISALAIYMIPGFENPTVMLFFICFSIVIGIPLANYFESIYGEDPAQFTLDEFIGTWISLLFIPKIPLYYGLAFLIWRILDILKPFPARQSEKIKGGWGVIADDMISAIYSLIFIHIFISFIS
jgi:phosphatidylglycerophosphatase A